MYISLQSDNNALMSLVITAVILAIIGIGYILVRHRSQPIAWLKEFLRGPVGMFLFTLGRFLVGIAGVSVLFVTLLPGLSPLQAYLDPNLGLGGLIYFFIWPLIVLQIVVAFFPYKRAWVVSKPLAAWIVLLVAGYIAISLNTVALNGMYDFTRR